MILAVLDDLMFTSKIRAAASGLGVAVSFARSREAALTAAREQSPALVILDLDNPRTDPVGIVEALKADAATRAVPTLCYVSHVNAALIEAARAAGADEVLARSAFTQRLPDLLSGRR